MEFSIHNGFLERQADELMLLEEIFEVEIGACRTKKPVWF